MKQLSFLAAAALALASFAAHAGPGFTDSTVNPASYHQVGYSSDPSVTVTPAAIASGGNPGAALSIAFTSRGGPVDLSSTQGFIFDAFSYSPITSGALTSVDFSNDRYALFANDDIGNAQLSTVTRPLIYQNGQYYFAKVTDAVQQRGVWFTTAVTGLTSSDFFAFDFSSNVENDALHPDFSSSAGALQFGFANRLNLGRPTADYQTNVEFRYDNIRVSLNVAAVPEPQTWALLVAGLIALGWAARFRRARGEAG